MVRRSRVAGVAIEDALELWAVSLREVKRRIRPLVTQERVAVSAGLFLDGLLGPERRGTSWMRAEAAGDPGPWRQQAILGRGRWEAAALRGLVRGRAGATPPGCGWGGAGWSPAASRPRSSSSTRPASSSRAGPPAAPPASTPAR